MVGREAYLGPYGMAARALMSQAKYERTCNMSVTLTRPTGPLFDQVVKEETAGYVDAALWVGYRYPTGNLEEEPETMDPYFQDSDDVSEDVVAQARVDVEDFVRANWGDVWQWRELRGAYATGHDFLLTRNGHGAGFWDRYNSDTFEGQIGDRLTDAARVYGDATLSSYGVDENGEPNAPQWD